MDCRAALAMTNSGRRQAGARQRGFGYMLMLFALAAIGLALAGAGQVWATAAQRDKEAELLFIGNQFRQALQSYHAVASEGANQYPEKLEDLLQDRRFPVQHSHLRQLYRDPMTGGTEWGLVKAGERITGVFSRSKGKPLKTAFQGRDQAFAGATAYDQWVFSGDAAGTAP